MSTLKRKFVSCPAGGHDYDQSGGRKISFFFNIFFSLHTNDVRSDEGKKENILKSVNKNYLFGTYRLTRAVYRKQLFLRMA